MMIEACLRLLGKLPLPALHRLGELVGRAAYRLSPRYAARLTDNLAASGLADDPAVLERLCRSCVRETGKGLFELLFIWFRPTETAVATIVEASGWHHAEAARAAGRGILFLTPHLGCFDVAALYAAVRIPITVLYRPPKLRWLDPIMRSGRERAHGRIAPTTLGGVRQLLRALRSGEAVGMLPDHVPGTGEGEWTTFFGRAAYTMTLAGRLQQSTGCVVLLAFARRLPDGRGFVLDITPLEDDLHGSGGPRRLNQAIEALVRTCPEQYLWSYNRYKTPAGAPPPPERQDVCPPPGCAALRLPPQGGQRPWGRPGGR